MPLVPLLAAGRRHPDHTFEKLMSLYKHYFKLLPIRDLLLASPNRPLPLSHISHPSTSQRLRLNKGAAHFLRSFPHIFALSPAPASLGGPAVALTPAASRISAEESRAADAAIDECADRLVRILAMSTSRAVPLRAVFRAWRELGLPDEFEARVLKERSDLFRVRDNPMERNTHILELVTSEADDGGGGGHGGFVPRIDEWRRRRRTEVEGSERLQKKVDELELRYGFRQEFPPGMKLAKNYRSKLKEWQRLPYVGPYEQFDGVKKSKEGLKRMEKRAVGIVHEFLSLTVEKMADVEQVSQFRKWFGIELNVRDLFLDHPGMFYVSAKGKRHTVFLREAYEKGRLKEPNPIYDARRKLLWLVAMRRRGVVAADDEEMSSRREVAEESVKGEEEEQMHDVRL